MKNVVKLSSMVLLALVFTLASTSTFANVNNDKAVEKARKAVAKAAVDDWKTLAESSKILIRKNTNLSEALGWIEKSIAINKNVENLELLGDYYAKTSNNREAMIWYIEAIKEGKKNDFYFNSKGLEEKISKARK